MENNITVNIENLSEDERNILLGLIEKANKQKNKTWEPENDEKYYYAYSMGGVYSDYWTGSLEDKNRYLIGNCFKTKEDAEFAIEKLKVVAELKRFAEENNECAIDWNDIQDKHIIYLNCATGELCLAKKYSNNYGNIVFTSEEIARQAIKTIGEDRLKKYYFEVED